MNAVKAAHPVAKVAFENPETFTGRRVKDHADFSKEIHAPDPNITVIHHNSNANITTQTQNVNADIAAGAKGIVLAAVDQNEDAPLVNKAERGGIKVLAYDRMIQSPKLCAYDSFDNVQVGAEQGNWLAHHLKMGTKSKPTYVIEIRGGLDRPQRRSVLSGVREKDEAGLPNRDIAAGTAARSRAHQHSDNQHLQSRQRGHAATVGRRASGAARSGARRGFRLDTRQSIRPGGRRFRLFSGQMRV